MNDSEQALAAPAIEAMNQGRWQAAEPLLRQLVAQYPPRYRDRLALTLFNLQQYAEAQPLLEQLADEGAVDIACVLALAACRERGGDTDGALRLLAALYEAAPTPAHAVLLVSAQVRMARRAALDEWLPRLLAAHPGQAQLLAAQAEHALLSGDYPTGFALQQHRWAIALEPSTTSRLDCPAWDGTPFDGTLLVCAEQGLGDEILAASLLGDLAASGQQALVGCEPRLLPLFRRSFPTLEFCDRHGDAQARRLADQQREGRATRKIEVIELARYYRPAGAAWPARWLQADPQRRDGYRALLQARFPGKRLRGLSWRSRREHLGTAKSLTPTDLAPLLNAADCQWINLQYGDIGEDLATLAAAGLPAPWQLPGLDVTADLDGLAALLAALDDVVSTSNTTAHLAGALGVPTTVLLPRRYLLWYWGYDGEHTPWYPSLQLRRIAAGEDWQPTLAALARERPSPP